MNRRVLPLIVFSLSLNGVVLSEIPQMLPQATEVKQEPQPVSNSKPESTPVVPTPPVTPEKPKVSAAKTIINTPDTHPFSGQDYLKDLLVNAEARKKEIDQVSTLVDSTIHFQMAQVTKLIVEIKQIMAKNKKLITERYDAINAIIAGMTPVDFRLKTLYPIQLGAVIDIEKFLNN